MKVCILCGGPFEGLIAGFTPDGKPHHEDPRDCIAYTKAVTVHQCLEIVADELLLRAVRACIPNDVSVAMLAERMRQHNEYEWWKAMEGK